MKSRVFLSISLVLAMVVAGCGSGDEGAATTQATNQSADNGGDDDGDGGDEGEGGGDSAPSASGTAFPEGIDEDFLVPVPAGWEIDIYEELAEQGVTVSAGVQVLYPNDDFDRIIAFYDDWTEQDSVDHVRSEAGDTIVYQRMEAPVSQITVQRNFEERDGTWTFLVITVIDDPN